MPEEGYAAGLSQGQRTKPKYEITGEVDYVAAMGKVDMNVGMPGKFAWDWFHAWASKGLLGNRFAVMSDADLLTSGSISTARQFTEPYLIIHSDNSFLPTAACRHLEAIPSKSKKLLWEGETAQWP